MKIVVLLLSLVPLCACSATRQSVGDARTSKTQFELMRSLAGDWTGSADTVAGAQPVETSFHLTGNGSTVVEILFRGSDHEMISMYHLDGANLMHTHYCAAGNQPRMIAQPSDDRHTIQFAFHDATNMPDPNALHMHEMKLHVIDADRIEEWWTGYVGGKPHHTAHFALTRKK